MRTLKNAVNPNEDLSKLIHDQHLIPIPLNIFKFKRIYTVDDLIILDNAVLKFGMKCETIISKG